MDSLTTSSLTGFVRARALNPEITRSTTLNSVFDSLTFLDFFIHIEGVYGDSISLDEIVACQTFGEVEDLLELRNHQMP
jgi:acyl carrier protein